MELEIELSQSINKIYVLPFSVGQVYHAWTSSDTVIAPATSMKVEPRVGGIHRLDFNKDGAKVYNEGRFLQVVPEHVIQYTWEWNGDGDVTQITVLFIEHGTGTELHLIHDGFCSQESLDTHAAGWDRYMRGLSEFLAMSLQEKKVA